MSDTTYTSNSQQIQYVFSDEKTKTSSLITLPVTIQNRYTFDSSTNDDGSETTELTDRQKELLKKHLQKQDDFMNGDIKKSIMIGDSENDADAAKSAGIPMILLENGYTNKKTEQIFVDKPNAVDVMLEIVKIK